MMRGATRYGTTISRGIGVSRSPRPSKRTWPPDMSDRRPYAFSRHHRRPKSHRGETSPENILPVPVHHHRAWHLLFRNHEPQTIASIINQLWLDPEYEFV